MQHGTLEEIKTPSDQGHSRLDPFRDLGIALTNWTIRYVPDTWVIAVILNVIVFAMALTWGKVTMMGAMAAWGKGFWALLTLMAEFSFAIMVAYACASAPVMARLFNYLSSLPNPEKPWQAVLAMAIFSLFLSWCNWAVSVTMSAMFAPYLAKNNPKADWRMLVTGAYTGMATLWASGLSSTAPLVVATPDNFLIKAGVLKEIITVDRTILAPYNFAMIAVGFLVVCMMMVILSPRAEKASCLTKEEAENLISVAHVPPPENPTFAQKLNWWPGWNILCGVACIAWMIIAFIQSGVAAWNIDMYNLCFLIVALFLTWRPVFLFDAFKKGISGTWGILAQFPLYGAIFGLVVFTNLGRFLTDVFASIATPNTYLPLIYWYSGLLSYFVPSAGAKWSMEAPYILPAAQAFGISAASVTLAYTWGDMLTHLLQPFWAIAILDITKTRFGQIAGFAALLFFVYSIAMTIMIFLMPLHL